MTFTTPCGIIARSGVISGGVLCLRDPFAASPGVATRNSPAPPWADGRFPPLTSLSRSHFLHERLIYDPASGELRWRPRPSNPQWSARFAGRAIRSSHNQGYVCIALTHLGRKRSYLAHRVAFAMAHGRWPEVEIDHRNRVRVRQSARLSLREATDATEQHRTCRDSVANATGYTGVFRQRAALKRTNPCELGGQRHIGCFANKEEAGRAYLAAKRQFHPFATLGG